MLLFPPDTVNEVGDPLDRHYTPLPTATGIVARLKARMVAPRVIVEPSVGSGTFAIACRRVWPDAEIFGIDIDPTAPGRHHVDHFICADWPTWAAEVGTSFAQGECGLVIGNPPFTTKNAQDYERARSHVESALRVGAGGHVSLILPWAWLAGVGRWVDLLDAYETRPNEAWPVRPRPWGNRVRETANYVWHGSGALYTRTWPLPEWR